MAKKVTLFDEAFGSNAVSANATVFNNLVFTTQVPNRSDGTFELGSMYDQTMQTLQNLRETLEQAGSRIENVLQMLIFLPDIRDRDEFNRAYIETFNGAWPSRASIGISILTTPQARLELSVIAAITSDA